MSVEATVDRLGGRADDACGVISLASPCSLVGGTLWCICDTEHGDGYSLRTDRNAVSMVAIA